MPLRGFFDAKKILQNEKKDFSKKLFWRKIACGTRGDKC